MPVGSAKRRMKTLQNRGNTDLGIPKIDYSHSSDAMEPLGLEHSPHLRSLTGADDD